MSRTPPARPTDPTPSVGQVVHHRVGTAPTNPAIITRIHADGDLTLTVFGPNDTFPGIRAKAGEWSWPPRV
jgi:hypothetical protein